MSSTQTPKTTGCHAWQRVEERLAQAGFDADTRAKVFKAAELLAKASRFESEAIRLIALPDIVGKVWGEQSNGNEVWAIVRNRTLATVMLRRSTQPKTTESLRVSKVTIIA